MSVSDAQNIANGVVDHPQALSSSEVVEQPSFDKTRWLTGPSDIEEQDLYVEAIDATVKIKGLTAAEAGQIQNECTVVRGDQFEFNSSRSALLTFMHGVVEPKFTEQEVNVIQHKFGPAFGLVVEAVNDISKGSPDALKQAKQRFRPRR